MASPIVIAKQFVDFYYQQFDDNAKRAQLASLYRDHSMLTFENNEFAGTTSIIEKLTNLPFAKVIHKVTTVDAQPSQPGGNALLVLVTGMLQVDEGSAPLNFSQAFQLVSQDGTYYVLNDVFRLVYG